MARSEPRLSSLKVPGHIVSLDLRDSDGFRQAMEATTEHAGTVDIVVNAVGANDFGVVVDLPIDAMEDLFLTNTFVPITLAKEALGALRTGGAICPARHSRADRRTVRNSS